MTQIFLRKKLQTTFLKKSFFLLFCASFLACTYAYTQTEIQITAANYCDFLNKNAATDPGHLFDQKMGDAPETACIVRLGTPGKYSYQVIAGRENFPITYINFSDEESYCENRDSSLTEDDDFNIQNILTPSLGCSRVGFSIEINSNQSCMIPGASETVVESAAEEVLNVGLEVGAGFLLGVAGSHLGTGAEEIAPRDEQGSLFRSDEEPSFSILSERAEMSHNDARSLNMRADVLNNRIREQPVITQANYDDLSDAAKKNQQAAMQAFDANRAALQKAREPHDLARLVSNSQTAQTASAIWAQRAEWIAFEKTVQPAVAVYRRTIAAPSEAAWDQFGMACRETLQALTKADHTQRNLLIYPIPAKERSNVIDTISWVEEQKLDWAAKIQYANDQKANVIAEVARASEIAKRRAALAQRKAAKKAAEIAEAKRHHDELMQQQALEKTVTENGKNRSAELAREKTTEEIQLAAALFDKKNEPPQEEIAISDSFPIRSSITWNSFGAHFFSLSDGTKKAVYDTSVFLAQTTLDVTKRILFQVWNYIPNPITKFQVYFARREALRHNNTFDKHWHEALKYTDPNGPKFQPKWQLAIDSAQKAHQAWLEPRVGLHDDLVIYTQKNNELCADLVKVQLAGHLAKRDQEQFLSMPQDPRSQKGKDERAIMKKIAAVSQKKADDLWHELSEKIKTLDSGIPTSQRSKWNETITKIRNQQSLHILLPLREHADERVDIFTEKVKQVSLLNHESLVELAAAAQLTATAWQRIIDACLHFEKRGISTDNITIALETARYEKANTILEELHVRAQQKDKFAKTASHSLKNLEKETTDISTLVPLQNDAVLKEEESRQAWHDFIEHYNELNDTIPEQHKGFWKYNFGTIFTQAQEAEKAFLKHEAAL